MIKLGDKLNLSYLDAYTRDIYLGYEFKYLENWLNKEEFSEFISDVITHEFTHKLLLIEFDKTTCKLYDMIEHHFGNFALKTRAFKYIYNDKNIYDLPETWHQYITQSGIDNFYEDYSLSENKINQAFILCNSR